MKRLFKNELDEKLFLVDLLKKILIMGISIWGLALIAVSILISNVLMGVISFCACLIGITTSVKTCDKETNKIKFQISTHNLSKEDEVSYENASKELDLDNSVSTKDKINELKEFRNKIIESDIDHVKIKKQ